MLPRGRESIFFTGATASLRGGVGYAAFAAAKFAFDVRLVKGLDQIPTTGSPSTSVVITSPAPVQAQALFNQLATQFNIDPAPPPALSSSSSSPATSAESAQRDPIPPPSQDSQPMNDLLRQLFNR